MRFGVGRFRTIAAKVTWIIGVVSAVAVLVVSGWSALRTYHHLQQQSIETAVSQAQVVATYSSAAFAFGDREVAAEGLEALRVVKGVERAYLLDRSGRTFAAFTPNGGAALPERTWREGRWPVPGGFVFVTPVEDRAGVHGRLQVEVRTRDLRREAAMGALQSALLSIVALALAIGLARTLQPLLTGPIIRLERAAQRVRDTGDYSTRVAIEHDDELGRLGEAFNEMLTRIEVKEAELIAAQQQTEKAREQLELATEAAEIGLWDVDLVADTMYWPARVKAMFGIAADRPVTLDDYYQGVHPDDAEAVLAAFATAADPAKRSIYDVEYRTVGREDGAIRWVAAKGRGVFDGDGVCVRLIGTAIDITERKASEQALRDSEEQLRQADRRKDEFLAMLAHELRNPLAPIAMASAILDKAIGDPARLQNASQVISRQVRHMSALVDDLLDVSRVTRGLIEIEHRDVELEGVVHAALEQARPLLDAQRHALVVELPGRAVWVRGDRTRLVQVAVNLVNNAAKYTPAGGSITISLAVERGTAKLAVSDTGIGIGAELLPHVFDLFVQGERTPDRSQGGLGIGLALVRAVVGLHGGTVAATSGGRGAGSRFTVCLPLSDSGVADVAPRALADAAPSPRRVLVVDDNEDAANSLAHWLGLGGHDVHIGYSGADAIALAANQAFDVFILDIGLPDMSGHELLGRLKAAGTAAHATFVAATGYGQQHDQAASLRAGFHHHLVKPIDPAALQAILSGASMTHPA